MLKAVRQYLLQEARPRIREIVFGHEFVISLLLAGASGAYGDRVFHERPQVFEATALLVSYAAIALGFCIAALTVVFTLPDPKFAARLAGIKLPQRTVDAYSDLLFVFSWTAISHWALIVSLVLFTLFCGSSTALLPYGSALGRRFVLGLMTFLTTYCLAQFLIVLITISQVGRLYIDRLQKKND